MKSRFAPVAALAIFAFTGCTATVDVPLGSEPDGAKKADSGMVDSASATVDSGSTIPDGMAVDSGSPEFDGGTVDSESAWVDSGSVDPDGGTWIDSGAVDWDGGSVDSSVDWDGGTFDSGAVDWDGGWDDSAVPDFDGSASTCADAECGPPSGIPACTCGDGSLGCNTGRCLRNFAGTCGWEYRVCP